MQRSFWLVRFVFASDVEIEILSALVRVMRHELATSLKNYTNSYTVGVNVIFWFIGRARADSPSGDSLDGVRSCMNQVYQNYS